MNGIGRTALCNAMANPWTKKNPLLSLWLSAANGWAGAARGPITAAVKRQMAAGLKPPPKRKPKART
jgi:hypothetical protein